MEVRGPLRPPVRAGVQTGVREGFRVGVKGQVTPEVRPRIPPEIPPQVRTETKGSTGVWTKQRPDSYRNFQTDARPELQARPLPPGPRTRSRIQFLGVMRGDAVLLTLPMRDL